MALSNLPRKNLVYDALLSGISGDPFPAWGLREFRRLDGNTYRRTLPGLQAHLESERNPVFANVTLTLTVGTRDWADVRKNKVSITERELIDVGLQEHISYFFLEHLKHLCGMISPYIYEYDPRKGECLSGLQEDFLFDPPGFSSKTITPLCSICRNPSSPPERWGGGNLGPIHFQCGREWGVF